MKIAFLTETQYEGKWPDTFSNARTEICWQIALDSTHIPIQKYETVSGFDHVFVIFPKGRLFVSAEGSKISNGINPVSDLLSRNVIKNLKKRNERVYFVQEGPNWWWNDYEVIDQIHFFNMMTDSDAIFAHNKIDVSYYSGLFPSKKIFTIPSLMFDTLIKDVTPTFQDKVIVGGNFSRWYGGFNGYILSYELGVDIWTQTSHSKRENEDKIEHINHLPRLNWVDWMKELSTFKYGIHLMPTAAAGTFSLNCSYFGIPCVGNQKVDTQRILQPELSVDVDDLKTARKLIKKLRTNKNFYARCSADVKENYKKFYGIDRWKEHMKGALDEIK